MIFGFDIGTTSVGFAVIDYAPESASGKIWRLGVRIFPEGRDTDGAPFNQQRRAARLRRRQLRRRRQRLHSLREELAKAGLLPDVPSSEWDALMKSDPYHLRKRALTSDVLTPHQLGRALYHLAKRRHFKGRELQEDDDEKKKEEDKDEKEAKTAREETLKELEKGNKTLGAFLSERDWSDKVPSYTDEGVPIGAWLSESDPKGGDGCVSVSRRERKRGIHATRRVVEDEFNRIWKSQQGCLGKLRGQDLKELRKTIHGAIFTQRPVFWRKNTLIKCLFFPEEDPCPKGSWLSQQRRMLEKVNNLLEGGNKRPLEKDERRAILAKLQTQESMTWGKVRTALASVYRERGEPGAEKALKFNLEEGGEKKLIGNAIEAKLLKIFGDEWLEHPRKQDIRDAIHKRLWRADYKEVGTQRVAIRPGEERKKEREMAAGYFVDEFGITEEQAAELKDLKLPTGWEPYSAKALREFLPHLEKGEQFGALVNSPNWEDWRSETFPKRKQLTGEVMDRLPSPGNKEERETIAKLRNPTVARTRNELRKVINNLIGMFGKPALIRVELARDVSIPKREREEKTRGIRRREAQRKKAKEELGENGIAEPSRDDIEKWLLWEECGHRCPYTGKCISFDALFRMGEFEVEHIWPRSRLLYGDFRNLTLCHRDENKRKGNKTPFEYLESDPDRWQQVKKRVEDMKASGGGTGMSPGKVRRLLDERTHILNEDFVSRQLNDTGWAARAAITSLKRLWPDLGAEAPVTVQAVSGRVTAQLRRRWGLNNILADNGEKTRADHRHHAIDALTVACAHPGMTQKLSRYWQHIESGVEKPVLSPPWLSIRADAKMAVANIIVSHRVRKKVSGSLHKETVCGDTGKDEIGGGNVTYHYFVTRKKVESLSKSELESIRDKQVRGIVKSWVEEHGGKPNNAFASYPRLGEGPRSPEIRRVRLLRKQQLRLMAKVGTGYADLGNNHHIAIFRSPNGEVSFEVVSLLEASRRLACKEPIVKRNHDDGAKFIMSLSSGDAVEICRGDKKEIRVAESIWANGMVVTVDHNDATGITRFRPNAKSIIETLRARKLSIDPIGRIRLAND